MLTHPKIACRLQFLARKNRPPFNVRWEPICLRFVRLFHLCYFPHFLFRFFLFEQASERLIPTLFMYLVFDFFVFSVFYMAALVWASTAGGFGIFSSWKWQCAYISVGGVFRLALGTRQTWYRQDRPWSRRDQIFLIQEIGIWHYWAQISSPLEGQQPTAHSPLFFPFYLASHNGGRERRIGADDFSTGTTRKSFTTNHTHSNRIFFYVERFSDFISVFRSI